MKKLKMFLAKELRFYKIILEISEEKSKIIKL